MTTLRERYPDSFQAPRPLIPRRKLRSRALWQHFTTPFRKTFRAVKSSSSLRNLASMPLTVCGFVALDTAACLWNLLVGIAGAGVLLIILELLIADEDEGSRM
jgi:hypothetical protein